MKRRVRKRILVFSLLASALTVILIVLSYFFIAILPAYQRLGDRNITALENIHCDKDSCDTTAYFNLWGDVFADYVLVRESNFLIDLENFKPNFWIEHADLSFVDQFQTPKSYSSVAGELWRLYALEKQVGDRRLKILVGWIENAPFRLVASPASPAVDLALKEEAEKIANQVKIENGELVASGVSSKADGHQIIEADSGKILDTAGGIPTFIQDETDISSKLFYGAGELYLVRSDFSNELQAVSLKYVTNIKNTIIVAIIIFVFLLNLFYLAGSTVLRKQLFLYGREPLSMLDSLRHGEGQKIEFKRGFTEQEVMKTMVAFANTNDGTIFLGIDDNGHITGLNFSNHKEKDKFLNKFYTLVRTKIKPIIPINVDFEEIRGYQVVKIFVPRGEEPLYFLDGVVYVRHGDSDIVAEPSIIKSIWARY